MVNALILFLLLQSPKVIWDDDDRQTIPEPTERRISTGYDFMTGTYVEPLGQVLDAPRNVRKLLGRPKEAENINTVDEVPNSSWFTNRNFLHPMSVEEIMAGPNRKPGPSASGRWTVDQCKLQGVSAGIRIKDSDGDIYLLKFDPPNFPELSSSADVIGAKIFYAAGYNVPSNSIVVFDRGILQIKPGVQCREASGAQSPLDEAFLERMFNSVAVRPDGKIRALASKYLDGKPKGPFSYLGWRADDPNDVIAHEHRRELRGLRVIAAFINHSDVKQLNTLDMYVDEGGRKYLKHHLIDFGSALGSSTLESKTAIEGYEYAFDTGEVLKNAASLGLRQRRDDIEVKPIHPSLGFIDGASFDPAKWKSNYPIASFENLTDRDGYWAAKIVAAFTDDQLRAIIRAGEYSDPKAEEILLEVLRQRRDRIAQYWFRRIAPLDYFEVLNGRLKFEDLVLKGGYDAPGDTSYTVTFHGSGKDQALRLAPGSPIHLPDGQSSLVVQIVRASSTWPEQKLKVRLAQRAGKFEVVEVKR